MRCATRSGTSSAGFPAAEAGRVDFGSTSGRGFESPFAPYAYGAILLVTVVLWFWFRHDIRKREREEASRTDRDDRAP